MSAAPSLHGNILDNMGDGVVAVDRRGVITSFNAAAGAILGIAPDDCPGRLFTDVFVLAKGLDQFTQALLDAINSSELGRGAVEVEVDGERRVLTVNASWLPDIELERPGGDAVSTGGVVAVFSDISEETRLKETVESQYAELQKAYRDIDETNGELSEALRRAQIVRAVATAAVVAVCLGLGWYAWDAGGPDEEAGRPAEVAGAPGTFVVRAERIVSELTVPGRLAPGRETDVQSPGDGAVAGVHCRYGEAVGEGRLLGELDGYGTRRRRRSIRARHIVAERRVEELASWESSGAVVAARRSLARVERALQQQQHGLTETEFLLDRGIVPRAEHDAARERYQSLQLDVEAALQDLREARRAGDAEALEAARLESRNLEEELRDLDLAIAAASVRAPTSGVVLRPPATASGGPLLKGAPVARGQLLLTVADVRALSVSALVDEVEIATIRPGQPVVVTADALPGVELAGEIANVASQASNAGGPAGQPALFTVVAALDDDIDGALRDDLRLGMSVDLAVVTEDRGDALLVPIEAVRIDERGPTVRVRTRGTDEFTTAPVETGQTTPGAVEIVAGVKPGDELVLGGGPARDLD